MGSLFSAPARVSRSAEAFSNLINEGTDLGTHHPSSVGGTINSARIAADSVTKLTKSAADILDSIPSKVDSIGFAAKITAAVGASMAIQSSLTQKRIAGSLTEIAKHLSTISQRAEAMNNSYLAGNQGFPVQILNFSNEVAAKRNSRFILVYYPSNLPDPYIHNALSNRASQWRYLDPQTCFFRVYHAWSSLVAHITLIRRVADYQNSEPICILFPSNCSSFLRDVFCDVPSTGGLDPKSLWFYGQVDANGPLTWLPGELTIAGTPLYASTNVSGLGFISMEKSPPDLSIPLSNGILSLLSLCLAFATTKLENAVVCFCFALLYLATALVRLLEAEVVVRRMRSCDGGNLMVNHSPKSKVDAHPPELKWTALKNPGR